MIIRKIRAAVIGIMVLSSMTIGGSVFAGSPAVYYDSQDIGDAEKDRAKRREAVEKTDLTAAS